jgi:hypothetical protein
MGKYAGFNSEHEYDQAIDQDCLLETKLSIDEFERKECRKILRNIDEARKFYGESLDDLLAHYRELFPEEFKGGVSS